jgi:hypothetical protein
LENKIPATRHYWHLWDAIEIREGLLFKKFHRKDGSEIYTQLLVPFEIKNEVLKNMHNSVMSGHLGKKKTKGKLSQRYLGKCSNALFSETTNIIKAKLYMNVHWMVLYKLYGFVLFTCFTL